MKKRLFLGLFPLFIIACQNADFMDKGEPDKPGTKTLVRTLSPDNKKLLTLKEYCFSYKDSTRCHTQVFIDFKGSGAGVYAPQGKNLGIKAYWKDNETIVIETKKEYQASQKWPQVQSFRNIVKVKYIEK